MTQRGVSLRRGNWTGGTRTTQRGVSLRSGNWTGGTRMTQRGVSLRRGNWTGGGDEDDPEGCQSEEG